MVGSRFMGMLDSSRDNGSIGVSVSMCVLSARVSADERIRSNKATRTRHTRSRKQHVIRSHTICGYLGSVHSLLLCWRVKLGNTTQDKRGIDHFTSRPTQQSSQLIHNVHPRYPTSHISPGIPHPLTKIATFRPFRSCWYGSASRVALKTAIKPDS